MDIQADLTKFNISPDPLKDQFFLSDENLIAKMVDLADINKRDIVLEVGAGIGNLTRPLAKLAAKVIAYEIDTRFKPPLSTLPSNVEIHYEDAWDFVQLHGKFKKKKVYNKMVSNLPYSFSEQLLHNLTFWDYDKVILLVPLKFIQTVNSHPIFKSFFIPKLCLKVDKSKFYPQPKTNSAVIDLLKLPDPISTQNLPLYLRQYLYQHEDQLVKNSLREGLIEFAIASQGVKLSKKQAADIIKCSGINPALLGSTPSGSEIYDDMDSKFQSVDFRHYSSASS